MIYLIIDTETGEPMSYVNNEVIAKKITLSSEGTKYYKELRKESIFPNLKELPSTIRGTPLKRVEVRLDKFFEQLEKQLNIDMHEVLSLSRKRPIVLIRSMIGFMLRCDGCTLSQTAKILNRSDHTTTKNWYSLAKYGLTHDEKYQELYIAIFEIYEKYKRLKVTKDEEFKRDSRTTGEYLQGVNRNKRVLTTSEIQARAKALSAKSV